MSRPAATATPAPTTIDEIRLQILGMDCELVTLEQRIGHAVLTDGIASLAFREAVEAAGIVRAAIGVLRIQIVSLKERGQ